MAFLEVIDGENRGAVFEIQDTMTLGRSPDNTVCLPDSRASRHHARVEESGQGMVIVDQNSANGTFVNRQQIEKNVPVTLNNGDEIVIGETWLRFRQESRVITPHARVVPAADTGSESGLSILMTGEETMAPAVNCTLDASMSMMEVREEEKGSEKGLLEAIERLQAMVKVSTDLGVVTKKQAVLEKIMDSIFDVFPQADRSFILLQNPHTGEMEPMAGRNRNARPGQQEEIAISRTIINTVKEKRQSILSSDAQQDDRFGMQQSIVELSIRSMMCAPFIWQDEILGVISVDTTSAMDTFDSDDLAMLTGIAAQASISIKNADLYVAVQDETRKRAHLSRYLSPDVVDGVFSGTIPLELGGDKKRGTVFFCDIVGFTAMSETMTAIEVIDKLNRYFSITTEVVTRNKGTLHKFGGDMIMAFWNVMLPDEYAEQNAIRTSIEMQVAVWSFDLDLENEGQKPIYLGIGCNTGEFAGGNIGGEDRMEYTIIGDNVNLGQRVESLAGRWQVFVSDTTYIPAKAACAAVSLPPVQVKGKSEPIQIYSIRGLEVAPGEMVLNIPVHVCEGEGQMPGRGMLTRVLHQNGDVNLHLSSDVPTASGGEVRMEVDIPEFQRAFVVGASVVSSVTDKHDGRSVYTRSELTHVHADTEFMDFLKPGAHIVSRKTWDEMKRQ